ncbi:MAG: hypothetical protein ABC537_02600 [Candidatus Methanosuratincola sp.]
MRCKVCGRGERGEGMCDRHAEAERKLREHFNVWAERTGLKWTEYLEAIIKNERTGKLVKEVATHLLQNGG